MSTGFPFTRLNYVKRNCLFEHSELFDEGFNFDIRKLKNEHSDVSTIHSTAV
jgi:hypothetical protein